MNFALSEEQELLSQTLASFVDNECPTPRVRELYETDAEANPALWSGLVEIGVSGLALPEAYGGAGLGLLELALVAEQLGRGAVPVPFLAHTLAGLAIALGGDEAQRERWLPRLAAGDALGSVALCSDDGGWAPERASASLEGGKLRARFAPVPSAASADLIVVALRDGGLAVVERSSSGVVVEPVESTDRTRPVARLTLENAPAELLAGANAAARVRDAGLALLAADAFGAAHHLVRMCAEYAGTREQFGRRIGEFQAVKHGLANMALEIDPTRGLWWYASHAFDAIPDEAPRAAALAKSHITDRALEISRAAVEAFGGIGFTWEGDVQIWFKRVLFDRQFLGTPEQHRERAAQLAGW